ncbi:Thrombospondin type 1 domain [Popillia japonica]|uniref:Thrombospondin type 1 domain n=1 Tax=Popillia japonica TaxID=7064 RepID=A0AAW1M3I0_POPJA
MSPSTCHRCSHICHRKQEICNERISSIDVPDRASVANYRKPLFGAGKNSMAKRSKFDDVKFFEGISESVSTTSSEKPVTHVKRKNHQNSSSSVDANNYDEIKLLLAKLLDKIGTMEKDPKRNNVEESHLSRQIASTLSQHDGRDGISSGGTNLL